MAAAMHASFSVCDIYIYMCGIVWNIRRSGCTVATLLISFMAILGNFREVHFAFAPSEARHLICQCYIIK